jgi:LmbE family N-acetylglucosaminyl deacetylase
MEAVWMMADLIRQYKPTVILTHWQGSMHVDHINTYHIVHKALFRAALPAFERERPPHSIKAILYPENWEDMEDYTPDVYVDVSDVWDDYLKLLNTHVLMRDSLSGFRYYDYYNALGTTRGALAGYDRAVTLMRPHSLYNYERNPGLLAD